MEKYIKGDCHIVGVVYRRGFKPSAVYNSVVLSLNVVVIGISPLYYNAGRKTFIEKGMLC